jgi:iron(III) transport system permease protein
VQQILEPLGVERLPDIRGFPGAALVLAVYTYPIVMLMCQAVLRGTDPALEDAARSLGRSARRTFQAITWTQIRAPVGAGALLVALYTLRDFGAVAVMRVDTFTRVIYVQYQSVFDRASAAALALVLVAVALVLVVVEGRGRRHSALYRAGPGAVAAPRLVDLGSWKWPALAWLTILVAVALVIPAAELALWLVRGVRAGEAVRPGLGSATVSSIVASTLGAIATIVPAFGIAWIAVRRSSRRAQAAERVAHLGYALPGVVAALAFVFVAHRFPTAWRVPDLGWLVAAYVVLFLPPAASAIRSTLLAVRPSLEEAARALGQRPSGAVRRVTLPAVMPGVGAAFALVFLTAMKELPATLILGPLGFETLATQVWSSVREAYFARAAAPALLLVLTSSVPLAFLLRRVPKGVL